MNEKWLQEFSSTISSSETILSSFFNHMFLFLLRINEKQMSPLRRLTLSHLWIIGSLQKRIKDCDLSLDDLTSGRSTDVIILQQLSFNHTIVPKV